MPSQTRAHVVPPRELIEEVDRLVGPEHRSQYFVKAAREKLARLRRIRAADVVRDALIGVDLPGWETSESTREWVREMRSSDRTVSDFIEPEQEST